MLRSRTVNFDDGEVRASITVRASTTLIGTRRVILHEQSRVMPGDDAALVLLRRYTYPDVIAPSEGTLIVGLDPDKPDLPGQTHDVLDLPFDVFCQLPEALTGKWEQAVYELNPHWLPVVEDVQKKEVPTSTGVSPA